MSANVFKGKTEEEKRAIINKGIETRRKNKIIRDEINAKEAAKALELEDITNKIKEERKKLRHYLGPVDESMVITGKTLLDEETIVQGSVRWLETCGVYFLIKNKKVIYVGQSVNIYGRIAAHSKEKDFNSFAFIRCPKERLDKLESLYIHTLRPEFNGENGISGLKYAPLNLEALLSL